MRWLVQIIFAQLFYLGISLSLHADSLKRELKVLHQLLKENRAQMVSLIDKKDEIQKRIHEVEGVKSSREDHLKHEIHTRIAALLHWPVVSFKLEPGAWIKRDQLLFSLSLVRQVLLRDTMQGLRLAKADISLLKEDLVAAENEIAKLKNREHVLSLQLEELPLVRGKQ